jgi:hypothetical protein
METLKIEFWLEAEDYLNYELFTVSKSERFRKKRMRSRIILPTMFGLLALVALNNADIALAIIFGILGLTWLLFYPAYEGRSYRKHYKKHIDEFYRNRFGKFATVEFDKESMFIKDEGSETKIQLTEISDINEIGSSIYINIKTGGALIIPKGRVKNLPELITRLKEIAAKLHVEYMLHEAWEWR